jgi:hypothetical protein
MKLPCEVYASSSRIFDRSEVQLVYPSHYHVRKIKTNGTLSMRNIVSYIYEAIAGFEVGVEPIGDTQYTVWFWRLPLGELDLTTASFSRASGS